MPEPMLIGEAWGKDEDLVKRPFVGPTGQELQRLCGEAGIEFASAYKTNVFNLRPANNALENLCVPHKELPKDYPLKKALSPGNWVAPQYLPELTRLRNEVQEINPNIIIAFGATALWALSDKAGINKNRGIVMDSNIERLDGTGPFKMIATYHPAHVLVRAWHLRPTLLADMIKGRIENRYPEIRYPDKEVWIAETLDDLTEYETKFLLDASILSYDIETARGQITCISLATTPEVSFVLPFWRRSAPGWSYWSRDDEVAARLWLRRIMMMPMPKLGQNSLYDTQYLNAEGIEIANNSEDTMLIHHALHPELPKGLGFLGSVYTNNPEWKSKRPRGADDLKREDE